MIHMGEGHNTILLKILPLEGVTEMAQSHNFSSIILNAFTIDMIA
jgi:hypothetical protein